MEPPSQKNTPQKILADFLRGPRTCTSDRDRVPNRRSSDCYARSASIASGWTDSTLAMRHLFAKRAHCKWHNLRHRKGAAMPSLVPERRMGLPAKCTFCGVPVSPEMVGSLQGGTIGVPAESIFGGAHEGETRRKGVTTFFIMSKARRGGHVRFSTPPFSGGVCAVMRVQRCALCQEKILSMSSFTHEA